MQLIDFIEFRTAKQTVKLISKDDSKLKTNGEVYYLSEDSRMIVDFDRVKTNYLNSINLSEEYAASADALCQLSDGDIYLIEFKNGDFEPSEISKKAKDSILIFSAITKSTIEFTRENIVFVLVVNNDKYDKLDFKTKRALALAQRGNCDYNIWGLGKLKSFCFKNVVLYSASKFNKWLAKVSIV